MKRICSLLFFVLAAFLTDAQNLKELDSLSTLELIDTLFIDRDFNNWSFRFYTNLKEQRMRISNDVSGVSLIPNNPFGVGIGVATKKLVVDLGFNLKTQQEQTKRFDLQGFFIHQAHQVGFFFQNYQGFNVRNKTAESTSFRDDISLQSSGIRYLHLFNAHEYSFSSLKTGLARQRKSSSSFGIGGFLIQISQRADSTFVDRTLEASFNDQAQIVNSSSIGLGGSVGFSALIVLPKSFFIGLGSTAGLGLNYHTIETMDDSYIPDNPLVYQMGLLTDIGYNGEKVYVNLSANYNLYGTDLGFGNRGSYNQVHAKLAIGFKAIKGQTER